MGGLEGAACYTNNDCYNLDCNNVNTTTFLGTCGTKASSDKNVGIGLVGAAIGVLCFGSSFVPIKKYKRFAGDGVFAQFLMNFGRFLVGVCVLASRDNRVFYWDAALGGSLWCLGNVLSIPIIQCVGIGLGVSIWGTTNMILGWASGHWGWWGIKTETSKAPALEYLSVAISAFSIVLFIFVKPTPQVYKTEVEEGEVKKEIEGEVSSMASKPNPNAINENPERSALLGAPSNTDFGSPSPSDILEANMAAESALPAGAMTSDHRQNKKTTLADTLGPKQARIMGVTMALISGCLYGICMDPAQHMMSRYDTLTQSAETMKYSPYGLDYVFSNNCGAMVTSSTVLIIYLILQKFGLTPTERYFDKVEHAKLLLPAFAAGAIGSIASAAWFFANQNLGLVVSFPIVAAGPGVVSSLWGALVFKEIHGLKNFIILGCAFVAVILAAVFSSLGKIGV
eukprot:GDKK01067819.1.p1 GENE.GDKK01067819.1~~GDKK01067819.1.p1  ORF type:complete len:514 (-),score=47.68 GDKK01067819.1:156-1517(-)